MNRTKLLLLSAVVFLFLSGVAGLIYQIVWARYLALFLGHTSYAVVAVLVVFMGGLALGNSLLGRKADQLKNPLLLYAGLEMAIAVYALCFPFYYDLSRAAFIALARGMTPGSLGLAVLKAFFSVLTIFIPTVLMGGTLPVMVKLVTRSLGELRERVSLLYFINSLGAIFGILVADFWLIPAFGLPQTVWVGAGLNFLVGVAAFIQSRKYVSDRSEDSAIQSELPPVNERAEAYTSREMKLVFWGIGVSGFVAMLYEVAWTRLLALAIGSSTHAFSIMVLTFISGIAVGAWYIGRRKLKYRVLETFAWMEIGVGVAVFVFLFFYQWLPFWFVKASSLLSRTDSAYS
ncbi:MAG TPA: hypothetical protein EYG38_04900, partial [Verrucomicrobia bacterium]|nr:hypothetical protein [Verrucomicrobiota bacterium]